LFKIVLEPQLPAQATVNAQDDSSIRLFTSRHDWDVWLKKEHRKSTGLWLRIARKDSNVKSVTYQEALDTALCYGWIDGQKRPESEHSWLQRFLPRSKKSLWSKINRNKALSLIANGEMKSAGMEAIENARTDGRWDAAYDSPSAATVPDDFQAALDSNPRAVEFFKTLDRANRYAILWRIQTAKRAETRARRIQQFVAMLKRHEKIHP
jgi:uncharacterized protein YdeI (YjbR/CyaY-like superfamily)